MRAPAFLGRLVKFDSSNFTHHLGVIRHNATAWINASNEMEAAALVASHGDTPTPPSPSMSPFKAPV